MRARLLRWLFVALSLAGVAFATWKVFERSGQGLAELAAMPPGHHALALSTTVVDLLFRALRIALLARVAGTAIAFGTGALAQLCGDGAGTITPARSGADPAKAVVFSRRGVPGGYIGAVLAGEAVCEAAALPVMSLALFLLIDLPPVTLLGPLAWCLTAVSLVGLGLRLAPGEYSRAPVWLVKLGVTPRRWGRVVQVATDFREGMAALKTAGKGALAILLLYSLGHIAARLLALPALVGMEGGAAELAPLIAWPFMLLYAGALVPAPAGGGLIEAGFAVTASYVPSESVGALMLWWRVYTGYLTAAAGLVALAATGRKRRAAGDPGPKRGDADPRRDEIPYLLPKRDEPPQAEETVAANDQHGTETQ